MKPIKGSPPRRGTAPRQRGFGKVERQELGTVDPAIPGTTPQQSPKSRGRRHSASWRKPTGADAAADLTRALAPWTAMLGRPARDPVRRRR